MIVCQHKKYRFKKTPVMSGWKVQHGQKGWEDLTAHGAFKECTAKKER